MGYDTVAYFTDGRGHEGIARDLAWSGWARHGNSLRPSTATHSLPRPIRYAPQYGGYCSAGVVGGEVTSNIDPEAWSIVEGKLYLNYSKPVREEMGRRTPRR